MKIVKNTVIEELAQQRLIELRRVLGRPLSPPIPIDRLAESVLGLDFLWRPIDELPGEKVLAGLKAKERLIVLNEKHRNLFLEKPGLERSSKGHEMGHWDLFIDKSSLDHPSLFDADGDGPFAFRNSSVGLVAIIKILYKDAEGWNLLREIKSRSDEPDVARAVNRYAAALLMPTDLLRTEALKVDRTKWPNLYMLAEKFEVTISALRVRLEQLGLLYLDENGKLYGSREGGTGQMTLDL